MTVDLTDLTMRCQEAGFDWYPLKYRCAACDDHGPSFPQGSDGARALTDVEYRMSRAPTEERSGDFVEVSVRVMLCRKHLYGLYDERQRLTGVEWCRCGGLVMETGSTKPIGKDEDGVYVEYACELRGALPHKRHDEPEWEPLD